MKLTAVLTVPVSLLLAQNPKPAPLSVVAVRHFILHDATRVAIEVSGPFEFHTNRLHKPERVYYDILNSIPRQKGPHPYWESVNDKLLRRVRIAETIKGVTRVVLDLGDNVEPTFSPLTNPSHLIVELRHAGGSTSTSTSIPIKTGLADGREAPLADPSAPAMAIPPARARPAASPGRATPRPAPLASKPPATAPATPEEIASAARHTSSGENSLVRALGLKINRVVIDPGHGGHDNGTEGPKGLLEKDLVLDVSQSLGKLIEDRMAAEVIYTRTNDTFIPLEGRTALANEKKADLFLSIHANSSPVPQIAGVETFYLNITGTREALDLAARENASAQTSIFELQDIIKKITLHDKSEESLEFARRIQAALFSCSANDIPAPKDRGVKSAPFVVLIGANMPSVLAEIGFLSNPREEALLKESDYRDKLAEAIFKGIERYAAGLSHFQVAARP
jgi:N-acetylmuramoyl-L-alanine amidase